MSNKWHEFTAEFRAGGWRSVFVSAIGYAFGMTVLPFYTLGAFVGPLNAAFGWSRAEVQGCLIFVVAATLVGAWGAGWLTDRFGVRLIAAWSQFFLGVTLILTGLTPGALWYWYLIWFLMTLLGMGTSPITWTRSVASWFSGGRGLALALALSGSGLCPLIAPAATALMIESQGWRFAYFALGAMVLLVALPVTLLLMPPERTAAADGGVGEAGSTALRDTTLPEVLVGCRFWLILASLMIAGFAISGLIPNLVPLMVDRGIPPVRAAGLLGVLGISIIVGRLVTGMALDRLWAPLVACLVLPVPAIACLVLASGVSDQVTIAGCIAVLGLATGAEFDLAPYIVTRYFGMSRYSQIYALQWIGFTLAAGTAPALFGYSYDQSGSYLAALHACAVMFVAAPALLLLLGRYPNERPDREGAVGL